MMNIDKRLLEVFIPCTEQEASEVYELLERAGLSTEGLPYPKAAKAWNDACAGVECQSDATFQAFKNTYNLPTLTLDELRAIVSGDRSESEPRQDTNVIRWVAVSERLPEFGETVLVYCKIYGRFLATYEFIGEFTGEKHGNWRDFNGNLGILPPVYWMPLPEPPCA